MHVRGESGQLPVFFHLRRQQRLHGERQSVAVYTRGKLSVVHRLYIRIVIDKFSQPRKVEIAVGIQLFYERKEIVLVRSLRGVIRDSTVVSVCQSAVDKLLYGAFKVGVFVEKKRLFHFRIHTGFVFGLGGMADDFTAVAT